MVVGKGVCCPVRFRPDVVLPVKEIHPLADFQERYPGIPLLRIPGLSYNPHCKGVDLYRRNPGFNL